MTAAAHPSTPSTPSAPSPAPTPEAPAPRTTAAGRLKALARAEFTLLGRSRATLFTALLVPLLLPVSLRPTLEEMDIAKAGLDVASVLLPAAIGASLLFGVYSGLSSIYTARREELVLKRLRTGELRDTEILAGAALPIVVTSLLQVVVLLAGSALLLDSSLPEAPHLALLGLLLGLVLCAALGAVTSAVTRSVESAQVTVLPLLLLSMLLSGLAVPLEVMPDRLADVCALLPLSPVLSLMRGGWTGGMTAPEVLRALVTALAWTAVALYAVRRWFRWEPRR